MITATMRRLAAVFLATIVLSVPAVVDPAPAAVSAQAAMVTPASSDSFNPELIIADDLFFDSAAMSEAQIQDFLDRMVGQCQSSDCLNVFRGSLASTPAITTSSGRVICDAVTGGSSLRASSIIYRAQVACGISAKVILVTLQKEQGLVTSKDPSNYALSFAMGWNCPDTTGCTDATSRFGFQVYRGARQLKTYSAANFARQPGFHSIQYSPTASCGSSVLNIRNFATAALYNYTPYQPTAASLAAWPNAVTPSSPCHSYGNRNFWNFYRAWFGSTLGSAPGAPTNLRVTTNSVGELRLDWAAPTHIGAGPVTDYVIEYKQSTVSDWYLEPDGVSTRTSIRFTSPRLNRTFNFRIYAVNAYGRGLAATINVTTPTGAPAAPTNLRTTTNDGGELRLDWGTPTDIGAGPVTDYVIEYKQPRADEWFLEPDGVSTATTITFPNPRLNRTFTFRVYAVNSFGRSPAATLTVTTPDGSPAAPTNLRPAINDGGELRLDWGAPSSSGAAPVTDYIIEYKQSTATSWYTEPDGVSTSTSVAFPNPRLNRTFTFRVYAVNEFGRGPAALLTVTTPNGAPTAPSALRPSIVNGEELRLDWDAPLSSGASPVTDYVIEYKQSTVSHWYLQPDGVSTNTTLSLPNPRLGRTFNFRIYAVNEYGRSPAATIDVTTPTGPPTEPTNLRVTTNTAGELRLDWAAPASAGAGPVTDYVIEYKQSTVSHWYLQPDGVSTNTTLSLPNPRLGRTFNFRIYAVNEYGRSPAATIDVTTPTG